MAGVAFCERWWKLTDASHETSILEVHKKTRRKTSSLKLQSVKIGGSPARNACLDAPTCLVSSLWFSCGLAVSMGEAAKPLLFEGFQAGCHILFCGRHGTLWHSNLFDNVSRVVLCGRRNTFLCAVFTRWVAVFVAGAALWRPPSSFCVAGAALQTCALRALNSALRTPRSALHPLHFTLRTLHSTVYTLHFPLYTLHSTLYTPHCTLPIPHFTLHTPHSTLYTPHSTLYTLHSTLHTPHSALYTVHSTLHTRHFTLHTPHSTLYTLHSTLHTLHSTLHTLHSTLHTLHSTLHTSHFTLHTLHCTLHTPHFTLYTPHSTLHTLQFTLHTLHFKLHTPHTTLYTLNSALHTLHFTLYTLHFTLYTPHSLLCTPPSSAFQSLQCAGTATGETCRLFKYFVLQNCSTWRHSGSWAASCFFLRSCQCPWKGHEWQVLRDLCIATVDVENKRVRIPMSCGML